MVAAAKREASPPMIVQSNNTRPSTIQGNNIQPNTTQTSTVSSDTVTVTVTLPASVIASGQEFNITVTPKTQRVTEPRMNTQHAQGVPLTPAHSPRARVPRFELPGLNLGPANSSSVGEDPFVDDDIHASAGGGTRIYPGDRDIQNDTEAVPNVFDVGSSDDGQLSPKPIYPLHPRYGGASRRTSQQVRTGARYYVITKGKKIGVFHDTWNRIQPLAVIGQGGVCTRQPSFMEAKSVWDKTKSGDKQVLMI